MNRDRNRGRSRGGAFSALWGSVSFLLMLGLLAIAGGMLALAEMNRAGPGTNEIVLEVPRGAGAIQIAAQLKDQGIIRNPMVFRLASQLYARDRSLQAGEYAIEAGASIREIVQQIASGQALQHEITIPEGWTTAMAMERVAAADFLVGDMPDTPPEGSILPDTYMVPRGTTRAGLVAQMMQARTDFLAQAWETRARDIPVRTPEEAIILASIVEKETSLASERDEVAGVFTNRLRQSMRLESDPTIIYGICKQFPQRCQQGRLVNENTGERRRIRASEIALNTGYNTYQIAALPPGPIANPGREAIIAVLNPPTTQNLFFVALEPGNPAAGHVFSRTYAEHDAAVRSYRAALAEAERAANAPGN
ncbi:MAG: endolytic transglycosylase MltG [Caulobacterales bacterium]|jgi:UPF0755 protein